MDTVGDKWPSPIQRADYARLSEESESAISFEQLPSTAPNSPKGSFSSCRLRHLCLFPLSNALIGKAAEDITTVTRMRTVTRRLCDMLYFLSRHTCAKNLREARDRGQSVVFIALYVISNMRMSSS